MVPIEIRYGLPYVKLEVKNGEKWVFLPNSLTDTGPHSTLLATDSVAPIELLPESADIVQEVFGIGGSETVVGKRVQRLSLAGGFVDDFTVELGAMDYGIDLDAIVGLDLLTELWAVIDLQTMELRVVQKGSADKPAQG